MSGHRVRVSDDVLKVEIFSGGRKVFKGVAPTSDSRKVSELLGVLRSKGVSIKVEGDSSWW